MKNYLVSLKKALIKNKVVSNDDNKKIIDIANKLGLEFAMHSLENISEEGTNRFIIHDMIFLYPINDGKPTCPFEFYKGKKLIIDNQRVYSEITNLDEIILQIVRVFDKALDEGIVIDPYYFMLRLDDEVKENYKGKATLVITEKAIRNQKLNEQNFDEANKYFINRFLDHFIGWNFGVSVNKNKILRTQLKALNNKVIKKGIREYAGSGFEVYGADSEAYNGLQHYYLPVENNKVKTKNI